MAAAALLACVPPPLEIAPPPGPPGNPTRPDFDPADGLGAVQIAPPGHLSVDPEPGGLSHAVAAMLGGEYATAADRMVVALRQLPAGAARTATADLLGETLFLLGEWTRFLEHAPDYSPGLDDDRVLAEAFAGQPALEISAPAEPAVLSVSASLIGTPAVTVLVNGRESRFWLDSGAGLTVLTETTARRCGIVAVGRKTTADTSTRHKVAVRGAVVRELRLGEAVFRNLPAIVLADRDLRIPGPGGKAVSVDGLVGWNALRHVAMDLELAAGRCTLKPPRINSSGRRNLFWLGYPCVAAATLDGQPLRFGLDTGATATNLRPPILDRIDPGTLRRRTIRITGAGGAESRDVRVVPRLAVVLGGQAVVWRDRVVWPAAGYAMTPLDGVIGADILAAARLELDPTAGWFVLLPHTRP